MPPTGHFHISDPESRSLVRITQFSVEGCSVNNDSFAELLKADPLLDFLNVHKSRTVREKSLRKARRPGNI